MELTTHPAIKQALEILTSVCDGAFRQDGVGFNGSDSAWGKRLAIAVQYQSLDVATQKDARKRLIKYSAQLSRYEIKLPSESELDEFLAGIEIHELEHRKSMWKSISDEIQQETDSEAHPQLLIAIAFLMRSGCDSEFLCSLACRFAEGRSLTEKQQRAAYKVILAIDPGLPEIGFTLQSEELEAHLKSVAERMAIKEAQKPDGSVKLIGNSLIVTFDYDPGKVAAVKSIKGAKWNAEGKYWQFPLTAAESLAEKFPKFEFDAAIASEVQSAKAEGLAIEAAKRADLLRLIEFADLEAVTPDGRSSYEHQKEAVRWAIETLQSSELRSVILALDMGLGKSRVSLLVAKAYQNLYELPVFVVCPASLKDNWSREAEGAGVAIEIFSWAKMPTPLETQEYILIADECHFAQAGQKSQRGKAFLNLAKHENCKAGLLLTGTPLKNGRPINLLPLLQASNHQIAANKTEFEKRYCNARSTAFSRWDTSGASHLDELSSKTQDVILRRKKEECLDLPAKTRIFVPAEVAGQRLKDWKDAYAAAKSEYDRTMSAAKALVLMTKLRKAASHAKIDAAIERAEEILEQGNSVVLFTEFVETAKELHSQLGGELLIGETPVEERQAIVDRFQSGQSKVFVSTSRAGGVGITLTASQDVILVDRPWTPGDAMQAEDRIYRIGQSKPVTATWLQWSEMDLKIDAILEQKQDRIDLVLEGKRKTLRGIKSPADIAKELAEHFFGAKKK